MSVTLAMEDVTRHVLTLKAHLNVPVVWGMFWLMMIATVLVNTIHMHERTILGAPAL